jgi:hypothetical protein
VGFPGEKDRVKKTKSESQRRPTVGVVKEVSTRSRIRGTCTVRGCRDVAGQGMRRDVGVHESRWERPGFIVLISCESAKGESKAFDMCRTMTVRG